MILRKGHVDQAVTREQAVREALWEIKRITGEARKEDSREAGQGTKTKSRRGLGKFKSWSSPKCLLSVSVAIPTAFPMATINSVFKTHTKNKLTRQCIRNNPK